MSQNHCPKWHLFLNKVKITLSESKNCFTASASRRPTTESRSRTLTTLTSSSSAGRKRHKSGYIDDILPKIIERENKHLYHCLENTHFVRGCITVRLNCLTRVDSAKLVNLYLIQHKLNPNQSNRRSAVKRYFPSYLPNIGMFSISQMSICEVSQESWQRFGHDPESGFSLGPTL